MKRRWFKEYGWVYLPTSWQGIVLVVLTFIFNLQVILAANRNSHSVSDMLYGIFPFVVGSLGIVLWIASKTSGGK